MPLTDPRREGSEPDSRVQGLNALFIPTNHESGSQRAVSVATLEKGLNGGSRRCRAGRVDLQKGREGSVLSYRPENSALEEVTRSVVEERDPCVEGACMC